MTGGPPGFPIGWSPDFATVTLASAQCLRSGTGPFGGSCLRWKSSVDRVTLATKRLTNVMRFEGPAPIGGWLSPNGRWLAYSYGACGGGCYSPGDGLYVLEVR